MATTTGAFGIERAGQTLVVTVQTDLRELDFRGVEAGASEIFDQLARGAVKDVVLDFRNTDYYGSTALGFFVKLWKRLKERDGRMAFCGVSAHEREILKVTNLDARGRCTPPAKRLCAPCKRAMIRVGSPAGTWTRNVERSGRRAAAAGST